LEGPYDTLFIFTDIPKPYIQEYPILNNAEYKYYSFYPSDTSQTSRQLHIAHYELLGPYSELHTNSVPNKLPIFNIVDTTINNELDRFTIHGFIHPTVVNINNAFDNNLETFTRPPKIIIEYNFPVKITHLRLAPRNANNMIIVDDVYQFYYFSSGKWKYSDTQVAKYNYLIFRDIPDNTIYWLRNISRGREELPFFYEDDKQVFINRMK
jgi:hypothetical protein